MYNEKEISVQKELVHHYLTLQEINQEIIDSACGNFFEKSILTRIIDKEHFGIDNLDLEESSSMRYANVLFGSMVFSGLSFVVGPLLSLPAAIFATSHYDKVTVNKVYKTLSKNRDKIKLAIEFFFSNKSLFDVTIKEYRFTQIKEDSSITNRKFLSGYLGLFSSYRKALLSLESYSYTAPDDSYCHDKSDNINEVANQENEFFQTKSDSLAGLLDESEGIFPEENTVEASEDDESSLLIISEEKLANADFLEALYTIKGTASPVEIISTISALEEELDNTTDLIRAEKISNDILPALKAGMDFQWVE